MGALDSHDLAQWLADAARDLAATSGPQATLDEVCERAVAVVAGCRSAAISELHPSGQGDLLAASDDTARTLHDLQYKLDDGPCVGVLLHQRMTWSDDLDDEPRWPRFAAEAVRRGVHSLFSFQLYTGEDTITALHMHSDTRGAFDEVTRDVAQIFGAHAALAIAGAREHAQMSQALIARQQIGQLTGILAERHHMTTDEAFALIVRSSQNHNVKIRDLAARIVADEDDARRQSRSAQAQGRDDRRDQ